MILWLFKLTLRSLLKDFEPVIQDEVHTLVLDVIEMLKGSLTPKQMIDDLVKHFELFKKANS